MQYFPLFMKLEGKPVLVVGGGEVACRKIEALIKARANVTIVSPQLDSYLKSCVEQELCVWIEDEYRNEYLSKDLVQVWATTENNSVNHAVYKDAKSLNLSVNVVDDQPYCDFITPSMINRGKIQIAISSGGASPVLVRNIRQSIEANLPQNTGLLAEFAAGKRDDIKLRLPSVDLRRVCWEQFLAHPSAIMAEDNSQLDALYQQLSANDAATKQGSLTFIEIPNAVDLITLRTLQTLQKAEMVLYPQQCDYALVDIARRDADRAPYEDFEDLISRLSDFAQLNLCVYVTREQMDAASSVCSSALRLYSGH